MLEALPNELVLEIVSGSRVQDLLATQHGPAQAETPFSSDHIAITKVEQTVTGNMDTDTTLMSIPTKKSSKLSNRLSTSVLTTLSMTSYPWLQSCSSGVLSKT
jgi:uncharacterized protein YejL (UPF0352 family)